MSRRILARVVGLRGRRERFANELRRQAHRDDLDWPAWFHAKNVGRNVAEAIHMVAEIGCVNRHEAPDLACYLRELLRHPVRQLLSLLWSLG